MAVVLVRGGEIVHVRGYGVLDARGAARVTPRSIFAVASMTKLFTAAAAMHLVEAGQLDLDAPVSAVLPDFGRRDPRSREITARQLLSHTSGLPHFVDLGYDHPERDDGALARCVDRLVDAPLVAAPGEGFHYSDLGFDLLGHLVSVISGEPFEAFVESRVLAPLGLGDSTLGPDDPGGTPVASPHVLGFDGSVVVGDFFPYNRAHGPCGMLRSSAADLGRWAIASLGRGEIGGRRILSASTWEALWKATVPTGRRDGSRIGLGWMLRERRGRIVAGHGGWDLGFRSAFGVIPSEGVGAAVLAHFHWAPVLELLDLALDVLLEIPPEPIFGDPAGWAALAGRYSRDGAPSLEVEALGATLWLIDASGRHRLTPLGSGSFVAPTRAPGPDPYGEVLVLEPAARRIDRVHPATGVLATWAREPG
jgi:CubicO group peptidase (beta-lactamase class C family)